MPLAISFSLLMSTCAAKNDTLPTTPSNLNGISAVFSCLKAGSRQVPFFCILIFIACTLKACDIVGQATTGKYTSRQDQDLCRVDPRQVALGSVVQPSKILPALGADADTPITMQASLTIADSGKPIFSNIKLRFSRTSTRPIATGQTISDSYLSAMFLPGQFANTWGLANGEALITILTPHMFRLRTMLKTRSTTLSPVAYVTLAEDDSVPLSIKTCSMRPDPFSSGITTTLRYSHWTTTSSGSIPTQIDMQRGREPAVTMTLSQEQNQ